MHDEPDLDKLLDGALHAYSHQVPQIGLDARVLRRLQKAKPRRWLWAAAPALGMAMLVVLAVLNRPVQQPLAQVQPLAQNHLAAPNRVPSRDRKGAVGPLPGVQTKPRIPKIVPPEPPTTQQRALQLLATQYPEQAVLLARQVPDELTIEPLAVEPLKLISLEQ